MLHDSQLAWLRKTIPAFAAAEQAALDALRDESKVKNAIDAQPHRYVAASRYAPRSEMSS